ncbi:hypothetical protein HMN09_00005500 [Mycena chlorophos]|uniref:Uncharacterized protein n=1 Tax=Mycena chlorophos TaxID=658473 RepID=A0A8H6TS21_MYCCL|nr:hypothetical protein HMN09_00005500 [Mycena chlorophos]
MPFSSFFVKLSLGLALGTIFAAGAPMQVNVGVAPLAGLVPGEYSASALGTDAAGHTTYALEIDVVEALVASTSGAASGQAMQTSWKETATIVAGENYISQTMDVLDVPGTTQTVGYECTINGGMASCDGYNPSNAQVPTGVVLTTTIPTAGFEQLTLDAHVNAGISMQRPPSMSMVATTAALGLMFSTVVVQLLV